MHFWGNESAQESLSSPYCHANLNDKICVYKIVSLQVFLKRCNLNEISATV